VSIRGKNPVSQKSHLVILAEPGGEKNMAIDCEVILRWDVTPPQRRALGNALWDWCARAATGGSIYQYLDNQALADLVAGRLPASSALARDDHLPYVFFTVPGEPARDRVAILSCLKLAISSEGIADVRIGGMSWRAEKSDECTDLAGTGGTPSVLRFVDARHRVNGEAYEGRSLVL
jgi:hypothetical protein